MGVSKMTYPYNIGVHPDLFNITFNGTSFVLSTNPRKQTNLVFKSLLLSSEVDTNVIIRNLTSLEGF